MKCLTTQLPNNKTFTVNSYKPNTVNEFLIKHIVVVVSIMQQQLTQIIP